MLNNDFRLKRGPWIETYTGKAFHLLKPKADDVDLEDIIHALAHINRYTGHLELPYTVGQHTIFVKAMMDNAFIGYTHDRMCILGLMHDFEEAYIGDISGPMKAAIRDTNIGANAFNRIGTGVRKAIFEHFDVEPPNDQEKKILKFFDFKALWLESHILMKRKGHTHMDLTLNVLRSRWEELGRIGINEVINEADRDYFGYPDDPNTDKSMEILLPILDFTPTIVKTMLNIDMEENDPKQTYDSD